jgi:hypothetical protein
MPWYVRLRSFHLSGDGPNLFCPDAVWFSHRPDAGNSSTFVGTKGHKFFSHRHVAFDSGCPNIHGWIIWSGFLYLLDRQPIGFSMAIF